MSSSPTPAPPRDELPSGEQLRDSVRFLAPEGHCWTRPGFLLQMADALDRLAELEQENERLRSTLKMALLYMKNASEGAWANGVSIEGSGDEGMIKASQFISELEERSAQEGGGE